MHRASNEELQTYANVSIEMHSESFNLQTFKKIYVSVNSIKYNSAISTLENEWVAARARGIGMHCIEKRKLKIVFVKCNLFHCYRESVVFVVELQIKSTAQTPGFDSAALINCQNTVAR